MPKTVAAPQAIRRNSSSSGTNREAKRRKASIVSPSQIRSTAIVASDALVAIPARSRSTYPRTNSPIRQGRMLFAM